jgi:hypothetical protein
MCWPKDVGPPQGTELGDWWNIDGLTGSKIVARYADGEPPGKTDMGNDIYEELGLMLHVETQTMSLVIQPAWRWNRPSFNPHGRTCTRYSPW